MAACLAGGALHVHMFLDLVPPRYKVLGIWGRLFVHNTWQHLHSLALILMMHTCCAATCLRAARECDIQYFQKVAERGKLHTRERQCQNGLDKGPESEKQSARRITV
jgi:hypothetical protein